MISSRHYLIDLQQLQQINEETNQARFIKRIVTPDTTEQSTEYEKQFYIMQKKKFFYFSTTDESTNSTRQATTTNNSTDARTEMMKDNVEIYSSFIQSLFTVLYEVYNSSAGPAVKHRCLQALLRMIYYSPCDLLEMILKQQSISSHIASMLASSDYKIVISALQMAEILMKKLPQIFSVYFYREGVVHQIEILIGFGISSSSLSISRSSNTSGSRSQLDLAHLNENSESVEEQQIHPLPKTNARRYYTTSESYPSTTRIETRSQRARLPNSSRLKTSTRSMFEDMSSRPIAARTAGASFSTGTLDISLGRGRPTRGTVPPPVVFRPTSSFDPSTYYPRPPSSYVPSPYAYASSTPAAASLMMSAHYSQLASQHQSQITLSSQEKAKLKEWIQNQAKNFRLNYFSNNSATSNIALQIISRLGSAVEILHVGKDNLENTKALRDIANIIAKGDVSPFEMVHSGLITKLYQYLTDDLSIPNNRSDRVKQFLNIFMNIPLEKNENIEDDETILKQYIIDLHNTQLNHAKTHHRNEQNVLSHLINKLHGCINQLEQFPIRGKIYFQAIESFLKEEML
jgi:E3 ubiquitin-protein ligase TRIP12